MIHIYPVSQANILVDKDTVRIAGLGNATIPPRSAAWTVEGETSTAKLPHGHAPELARPETLPDLTNPTHPTKAEDMCAFGVVSWEVWTLSSVWYVGLLTRYRFLQGSHHSLG